MVREGGGVGTTGCFIDEKAVLVSSIAWVMMPVRRVYDLKKRNVIFKAGLGSEAFHGRYTSFVIGELSAGGASWSTALSSKNGRRDRTPRCLFRRKSCLFCVEGRCPRRSANMLVWEEKLSAFVEGGSGSGSNPSK